MRTTLENKLSILHDTSLYLFFTFLAYGKLTPTISFFSFVFFGILLKKVSFNRLKQNLLHFTPFTLLFSLYLLSFLISLNTTNSSIFELQKRVTFLIIPFYFFATNTPKHKILLCIKAFIIGTLSLNLLSLFRILNYYTQHANIPLENGEIVQFLTVIHRPYLGFFLVLSCLLSFYLFIETKKKYWFIPILIHLFSILLINARASLGICLLSITLIITQKIFTSFHPKKLLLLIIPIAIGGIAFMNTGFQNRMREMTYNEPRSIIWPCAYHKISSNSLSSNIIGTFSVHESQEILNNCYKDLFNKNDRWGWLWEHNYLFNTHNQYLDYLLTYGFIGVGIFFWIIIQSILFAHRTNNYYLFSFCLVFILTCFFENLLSRQWGIYTFSAFIPLLLTYKKNQTTKR